MPPHGSTPRGFRFGIEAEYLLVDASTFEPLWYEDVTFAELNEALETISLEDLPSLVGLEVEPPHRKAMPFVVEGYHVPDADMKPVDLWPKGLEIRTPVCQSIEECVATLKLLYDRATAAMADIGYRLVAISHHPTQCHFKGPQNKRRYDFWQWAMEAMLTFGPDVNVSLPVDVQETIDWEDLHAKVNFYSPAMAALSLASPLYCDGLWRIRGQVGKSIRTYRRSVVAPALEIHLEEGGRLEFKLFEMSCSLADFRCYFLLWLTLLLDTELSGRASGQTRIYDLGQVAQYGLGADTVASRAEALLDAAAGVLESWGFDVRPLERFRARLELGRLPADVIVELFETEQSVPGVLRHLAELDEVWLPERDTACQTQPASEDPASDSVVSF